MTGAVGPHAYGSQYNLRQNGPFGGLFSGFFGNGGGGGLFGGSGLLGGGGLLGGSGLLGGNGLFGGGAGLRGEPGNFICYTFS